MSGSDGPVTPGIAARFTDILSAALDAWEVDENGSLSSTSHFIHFYEDAVCHLLPREKSGLSELEFRQCVVGSIHDLKKAGLDSISSFNAAYEERRSKILSKPHTQYFGLTRLPFHLFDDVWIPLQTLGQRASISTASPQGFDLSDFFISGYGRVRPEEPQQGLYLILGPASARSPDGALDALSSDFRVVLGLIAFFQNYGGPSWRIGRVAPMTNIMPGEAIVLYGEGLKRADELVTYFTEGLDKSTWLTGNYERSFLSACAQICKLSDFDKSRTKYLRTVFGLYHDAVSANHPDEQITRLWKLAEFATFSPGGTVDKIARRLSLTWFDSDVIYAAASAAGHRRNVIAHQSGDGVSADDLAYFFRYIVEMFIGNAMSKSLNSLSAWRSLLEIGSSNFDLDTMSDALAMLKKFSRKKGAPK